MRIVKTACGMCGGDYCGVDVTVESGEIVRLSGMQEHPHNRGWTCPQARAAIEQDADPRRLDYPMKRKGGAWERISWDEALDLIAENVDQVKERYGAQSLAVFEGEPLFQTMRDGWARRFMNLFGTATWVQIDHMCYVPSVIVQKLTYGAEEVDGFEGEHARCALFWGANPIASHLTSHWRSAMEARKRGAKVIVIDPRRTRPAERADIHAAIRPGSDIALALGLIHLIISEGLYDTDFVEAWCHGFDRLAERVRGFTPERVEAITGVPAEDVRRIAETYAASGPAWMDAGNALEHHSNASQTLRALAILKALTGNIDVPGGHKLVETLPLADMKLSHLRPPGLKRAGADRYPLFAAFEDFIPGDVFTDMLHTGEPYPVRAMLLQGGNPAVTWPNTERVRQGFHKLDFLAVMDLYMTETAKLADLVLPAASHLERTQLIATAGPYGVDNPMWYIMLRKKVHGSAERRSDWRFWRDLAHRMGYGAYFPWDDVEEAIEAQLEPLDVSVDDLKANAAGVFYGSFPTYRSYEKEGFQTPTGKVELYSHTMASYGYDPLPHYEEPAESPAGAPELAKRYPLVLNAGYRVGAYTNTRHRSLPSLRKRMPDPLAEIHPDTAAAYGVEDGDRIVIESPRGQLAMEVKVTDGVVPDTVSLPYGWEEANVNLLTDEKDTDPVLAAPSLRAELCRIRTE
jgi:anaerobic selenocysteine-containing dehydrogenase